MSFGWSAGDIVAALQLLQKVVVALQDTGGASSEYQETTAFLNVLTVTLQHLKALQAAPLDPDLTVNLEQLCEQVQGPLTSFCERISSSFERDLGPGSTRLKVLSAGRKIQWALSTSKKVKDLREKIGGPIAAIGIVLSQQLVQTTLQMPSEIQARIAQTIDKAIDTRIGPQTLAVHKEVTALVSAQRASSELIDGTIREVESNTMQEIQKQRNYISLELDQKLNDLSLSHEAGAKSLGTLEDRSQTLLQAVQISANESRTASTTIQQTISDLSAKQSTSTDLILRGFLQNSQCTKFALQKHSSASRDQTSSLHQKLDHMNCLMVTVKDRMGDLSMAQQSAVVRTSNSELQKAITNIQKSVLLLVSALHVLIRELIYLIAPHLVALYKSSIQPLLLCGDHFMFEDAIGRRNWLPCLQFQHWDTFYNLLVNTFQGEAGLSRVLNGQFVVLNGFNEVPIHKKAWRAGIQPKARVAMAVLLEYGAVRKGKCANPACPGQVDFGKDEVTRVCPICGKHLSTIKDSPDEDEDYVAETTYTFDFGSDIRIPTLNDTSTQNVVNHPSTTSTASPVTAQPKKPSRPPSRLMKPSLDKDIAAYKRVIWQHVDDIDISDAVPVPTEPSDNKPRILRPRGAPNRPKPSFRARKKDHQRDNVKGPPTTRGIVDRPSSWVHTTPDITPEATSRESGKIHYHAWLEERQQKAEREKQLHDLEADRPPAGGFALQDYQMQLMLLEQNNKSRLMAAIEEQAQKDASNNLNVSYSFPTAGEQDAESIRITNPSPMQKSASPSAGHERTISSLATEASSLLSGDSSYNEWSQKQLRRNAVDHTGTTVKIQGMDDDEDSDDEPIMSSRGRSSLAPRMYRSDENRIRERFERYSQQTKEQAVGSQEKGIDSSNPLDPFDPRNDADPFGLSASMHFPTSYNLVFDGTPAAPDFANRKSASDLPSSELPPSAPYISPANDYPAFPFSDSSSGPPPPPHIYPVDYDYGSYDPGYGLTGFEPASPTFNSHVTPSAAATAFFGSSNSQNDSERPVVPIPTHVQEKKPLAQAAKLLYHGMRNNVVYKPPLPPADPNFSLPAPPRSSPIPKRVGNAASPDDEKIEGLAMGVEQMLKPPERDEEDETGDSDAFHASSDAFFKNIHSTANNAIESIRHVQRERNESNQSIEKLVTTERKEIAFTDEVG